MHPNWMFESGIHSNRQMVLGEQTRPMCEWRDAGPIYRAVDSTGATIDFFLSETRDVFAARTFFLKALAAPGHPRPRVINVDGNPSYPSVVDELKRTHALGQRCRCRIVPDLNNIVEQDHRAIKRRINASLGFRSFAGAARTIQGYEAMHMIVCPAQGWCIQRESSPPGQESEAL